MGGGYGRAWRERDADSAAGLFTEDAEYRFSPFREPAVGSDAIHAYWEDVTSTQEEVEVRMGTPFVGGDLVAAEWWATMVEDGEETTITGCLLLRFAADGRCTALREYWFQKPGRRDAHPRLGRVATSPPATSRCKAPGPVPRGHPVDIAPDLEPHRGPPPFTFRPPTDMPRGQTPGHGR